MMYICMYPAIMHDRLVLRMPLIVAVNVGSFDLATGKKKEERGKRIRDQKKQLLVKLH